MAVADVHQNQSITGNIDDSVTDLPYSKEQTSGINMQYSQTKNEHDIGERGEQEDSNVELPSTVSDDKTDNYVKCVSQGNYAKYENTDNNSEKDLQELQSTNNQEDKVNTSTDEIKSTPSERLDDILRDEDSYDDNQYKPPVESHESSTEDDKTPTKEKEKENYTNIHKRTPTSTKIFQDMGGKTPMKGRRGLWGNSSEKERAKILGRFVHVECGIQQIDMRKVFLNVNWFNAFAKKYGPVTIISLCENFTTLICFGDSGGCGLTGLV